MNLTIFSSIQWCSFNAYKWLQILILKHSNEISILSLNSFLDYVQSHIEETEREKAHISELVLWPTYPACHGSLTGKAHLWLRFTTWECINPYSFLLISCHLYFSLHLPPLSMPACCAMFPNCMVISYTRRTCWKSSPQKWNRLKNTALMKLS